MLLSQSLRNLTNQLQRSSTITSINVHKLFRSTHNFAIAREIPNSFINALSAHHANNANDAVDTTNNTSPPQDEGGVSLAISRQQHDNYLHTLRQHIPTICLPGLENHPDSVFVEDAVVAIGNTACLMQPGHVSRRGEVDSMETILEQLGMVHNLHDMRSSTDNNNNNHTECIGDGGDVLYTGRHLFVGISHRTNESGFQFLKNAFAHEFANNHDSNSSIIAVPPVVQGKDVLHLKSAVTHLDEYTLLAPEGPVGDSVLFAMKAKERGYDAIRLPDILSCNAVVVNGHVIAQDNANKCEVSKERIAIACQERGLGLSFVDTSELAKKDAALTCCSVLLSL